MTTLQRELAEDLILYVSNARGSLFVIDGALVMFVPRRARVPQRVIAMLQEHAESVARLLVQGVRWEKEREAKPNKELFGLALDFDFFEESENAVDRNLPANATAPESDATPTNTPATAEAKGQAEETEQVTTPCH